MKKCEYMIKNITIIMAKSDNNIIGHRGKLPWHIPEDLKLFKQTTLGYPIIMGRKTFESLPESVRPLPGRLNVVLSDSLEEMSERQFCIVGSVEKALKVSITYDQCFIIGGKSIYDLFLPYANRMIITEIHAMYHGDTKAFDIGDEWVEVKRTKHYSYVADVNFDEVHYEKLSRITQ